LLVPAAHVPAIECLEAHLTIAENIAAGEAEPPVHGSDRRFTWQLRARLNAEPVHDLRLVIPFHRCAARAGLPGQADQRSFRSLRLSPLHKLSLAAQCVDFVPDSHTISSTGSEVILAGPGMLETDAELQTGLPGQFVAEGVATIWVRLRASDVEKAIATRSWNWSRISQQSTNRGRAKCNGSSKRFPSNRLDARFKT
jgi:hypothetical protein